MVPGSDEYRAGFIAAVPAKERADWPGRKHPARQLAFTCRPEEHQSHVPALRGCAGLTPEKIRGMTVLELGPGFNIGIPLHFLADGAEKVVGSDKFVPLQTSGYFVELYRSLRSGLKDDEKARFDQGVRLSDKVEVNPQRVQYIYGKEVDDLVSALGRNSMDLIVSNAVMEEIHDFDTAFSSMDQLLKPGGYMVHRIDLRNYGMFSKYGYHPLEFL